MQYCSELVHGQPTAFSLGAPSLGVQNSISAVLDADGIAGTETVLVYTSDAPYGRALVMTANGDPTNSPVYDVYGWDYLGQKMVERFTLAGGGVVAVQGKKAFYRLEKWKVVAPSTAATTLDLGPNQILGLPYKGFIDWAKEDGVPIAALAGITLAAPVLTDPATAITGDPRGTYLGALTLNGVKEIIIGLQGDPWVNAAGNGGLHGIQHYAP